VPAEADDGDLIKQVQQVRSPLPAITHVDYSARVQVVPRELNPGLWALLEAFRLRTGCPVLVNTSFNVRGEPIVCSPGHALRCFLGSGIDALEMGSYLVTKNDNPSAVRDIQPGGGFGFD
jgi:carbamoyltransferase